MTSTHQPGHQQIPFTRRQAIGLSAASLLAPLGLCAEQLKRQQRACILVWLAGAPSQMETWDPKPGTANGGPTKAIKTVLPGVSIAEHWPRLAKSLNTIAVIRSIVGKEAAHARGTYHLHTGRRMGGDELRGDDDAHQRGAEAREHVDEILDPVDLHAGQGGYRGFPPVAQCCPSAASRDRRGDCCP